MDRQVLAAVCKELAHTANAAWTATINPQTGYQRKLRDWMDQDPQEGDLVLAYTGFRFNDPVLSVGWFIRKTREPFFTQEDVDNEHVSQEERDSALEDVWYIKTFEGEVTRWTNEKFIKVPGSKWKHVLG